MLFFAWLIAEAILLGSCGVSWAEVNRPPRRKEHFYRSALYLISIFWAEETAEWVKYLPCKRAEFRSLNHLKPAHYCIYPQSQGSQGKMGESLDTMCQPA